MAAGLPRGALDIAVAETEQGEIHAVLAIHNRSRHAGLRQPPPHADALDPPALCWLAIEPVAADLAPRLANWQALPDRDRIGTTPPLTAEGEARR